jgi:hypothetical protein
MGRSISTIFELPTAASFPGVGHLDRTDRPAVTMARSMGRRLAWTTAAAVPGRSLPTLASSPDERIATQLPALLVEMRGSRQVERLRAPP